MLNKTNILRLIGYIIFILGCILLIGLELNCIIDLSLRAFSFLVSVGMILSVLCIIMSSVLCLYGVGSIAKLFRKD